MTAPSGPGHPPGPAFAWTHPGLTARQRAVLDARYPDARLLADHSWPFGIVVLEFTAGPLHLILKASETSHHLVREARAHRSWLAPLRGDVPELVRYDAGAGLLVTRFLPGCIAWGTPDETEPEVYRQAGQLLRRLHEGSPQERRSSPAYQGALVRRAAAWLSRAGELASTAQREAVARWLDAVVPVPEEVVPTHGDFQPRNWLVRPGRRVALIDFGRADLRPWYSDLMRMEHRYFPGRPELRAAFEAGYGACAPAAPDTGWLLEHVAQSLGTVVWAHEMGDTAFEEHGRDMLARTVGWLGAG